jgi:drug/metabolite transporter (DMT)-like permease
MLNKHLFTVSSSAGPHNDGVTWTASPLFCTSLQMFVAAAIAYIAVVQIGVQRSPGVSLVDKSVWYQRIAPLGLSRAIDIGCGNYALSLVTVALQQIVKATLPIFVTLLSVCVLRKRVSLRMVGSLMPIVVGTMVASIAPHHDGASGGVAMAPSMAGVLLAMISCFGRASKAVLNALLLSGAGSGGSGNKLRPLEIVLLEAPTTGAMILLPALLLEGPSIFVTRTSQFVIHPWSTLGVNVVCGGLMFATQAAYVTLIDETSALSCQVLMSVKMLVLVFFSVWWHHTPFTWVNALGVLVAGAGCVAYARAVQEQDHSAAAKKHDALPTDVV